MFTEIAVYYPRGERTGGPEALHQLVDSLRRHGHEAYLVPDRGTEHRPRVVAYEGYDAPERSTVEDVDGTAVVVAETASVGRSEFSRATLFRWWLSINNVPSEGDPIAKLEYDLGLRGEWEPMPRPQRIGRALHATLTRRPSERDLTEIDLAQSQYAWSHIFGTTRRPPSMVADYTPSPEDLASARVPVAERNRVVCFNPKKSGHLARGVAELMPNVSFVPIENMSREQVVATLGQSAVYLDLGSHPGKDRIPREAALAGAVVVAAMRGSAAFHADVPIPLQHKVQFGVNVVAAASEVVSGVLANLGSAVTLQNPYRDVIARERDVFDAQVRAVFTHGLRGFDADYPIEDAVERLVSG